MSLKCRCSYLYTGIHTHSLESSGHYIGHDFGPTFSSSEPEGRAHRFLGPYLCLVTQGRHKSRRFGPASLMVSHEKDPARSREQ